MRKYLSFSDPDISIQKILLNEGVNSIIKEYIKEFAIEIKQVLKVIKANNSTTILG